MDHAKKSAGKKAAELIEDGMIVGLGSGSTAHCFIQSLIEKKPRIQTVASSRASSDLAKKGGLEVLDINAAPRIDITVDGADEITPEKQMIKGGGGAHVREKILAASSNRLVIIVDESKQVSALGSHPLPVEILFYGSPATRSKIEALGFSGKWRLNSDHTLLITENGNLLFDIHFPAPPISPHQVHSSLIAIPGVVDTGFFLDFSPTVIVGRQDGTTQMI